MRIPIIITLLAIAPTLRAVPEGDPLSPLVSLTKNS